MYVCGVTVYDECHLGHARSAIVFDVIRRYLGYRGYQVNYVKNFTDVDDKILNRAARESIPWKQVTEKYVQAYYRDMNRLGVINPDIEPRATDHMMDIIQMIQALVEKGHAYQVDHDVFTRFQPLRRMDGWEKESWRICRPVPVLKLIRANGTRWTSRYGREQSQGSRPGIVRGELAAQGGTLNVRPCPSIILGEYSIFMEVAKI